VVSHLLEALHADIQRRSQTIDGCGQRFQELLKLQFWEINRDCSLAKMLSFPRRRESTVAFVDSRLRGNDGFDGLSLN
jgi:hypothetical protein